MQVVAKKVKDVRARHAVTREVKPKNEREKAMLGEANCDKERTHETRK